MLVNSTIITAVAVCSCHQHPHHYGIAMSLWQRNNTVARRQSSLLVLTPCVDNCYGREDCWKWQQASSLLLFPIREPKLSLLTLMELAYRCAFFVSGCLNSECNAVRFLHDMVYTYRKCLQKLVVLLHMFLWTIFEDRPGWKVFCVGQLPFSSQFNQLV